jgi:hypothetical protein
MKLQPVLVLIVIVFFVIIVKVSYKTYKEYYAAPEVYLKALDELDLAEFRSYDRDEFAPWLDYNKDSCDTRSEVLKRDSMDDVEYDLNSKSKCKIMRGRWDSVYDKDRIITEVYKIDTDGTKISDIDIDHMVPLKNAWDTGAYKWSEKERQAFANDMTKGHLVATSKSSNTSKGANGPETYLPKKDVCNYAADWISVKHRWGLQVYPEEKTKLKQILSDCSNLKDFPLYKKGEYREILKTDPEVIEFGITPEQNKQRKDLVNKYRQRACKKQETRSVTQANQELREELEQNHDLFGINNWEKLEDKTDKQICDIVGLTTRTVDDIKQIQDSFKALYANNNNYSCDLFKKDPYLTSLKTVFIENQKLFNNKSANPRVETMCKAFDIPG